jgi:type I restriction enzyme S subunit
MGSAVVALSRRDFLAYPVPIPTTEHRLAVAILDAIEERIEINRRINETLEAMARALFKSWFVDFDPVRAKGEGCATGLPKEISELFPESFEDSELGEVPKGWTVGKIGDLLALSRSGLNPGAFEDEVFEHYSIPAFDDGRTPKIEEGQSIKSNKFIVVPGCVLLSKLNPRTPRIWLPLLSSPLRARAVCSTEFLVTLPKHNSSQEFLYCLLSSDNFTTEFTTLVTGTSGSHQRVRPESLLNLDSVLPPLGLVQRFTELVSPMLHRINQNLAESGTLTAQRDTLLPKLLSGEIRIGQPKPPGAIQSLGEKG